jgi:hypothetical protein
MRAAAMKNAWIVAVGSLSAATLAPVACSTDPCAFGEDGGAAGDAGKEGGGTVVFPPDCDPKKDPKDAPACVVDQVGVFVSKAGSPTGKGTKADPVGSFAAALKLAGGSRPRVYVCGKDTFAEQVVVASAVSIYGGFACGTWAPAADARAVIAPAGAGEYGLDIGGVKGEMQVQDLEVRGTSGVTAEKPNSVAVRVVGSTGVAFARVRLVGGDGANGSEGTITEVPGLTVRAAQGKAASGSSAGVNNAADVAACVGSTAKPIGGSGGDGGGQGGVKGAPQTMGGGAGGTVGSCGAGGSGGDGAKGDLVPDADGAKTSGSIASNAWAGEAGESGAAGTLGQGGGGGAGQAGGGGGAGGMGGCGGAGGGAGTAGGASIALLSVSSAVAIGASELSTGAAGTGGAGKAGQSGQQGGFGGVQAGGGCPGGVGGNGANGGHGGGGAGGISVPLVYSAAKPTLSSGTKLTPGKAGAGGAGGNPGVNNGIAGVAQPDLQVQ